MKDELLTRHEIYLLEQEIQIFKERYSALLSLEDSYPKGIMDLAFGLAAGLNKDFREAQKLIDQRQQYLDRLQELVLKHEKGQGAVLTKMHSFEQKFCVV